MSFTMDMIDPLRTPNKENTTPIKSEKPITFAQKAILIASATILALVGVAGTFYYNEKQQEALFPQKVDSLVVALNQAQRIYYQTELDLNNSSDSHSAYLDSVKETQTILGETIAEVAHNQSLYIIELNTPPNSDPTAVYFAANPITEPNLGEIGKINKRLSHNTIKAIGQTQLLQQKIAELKQG